MSGDFRPGELVLLAFPFTGGTAMKRRPALVLLDAGDEDIIVARVTSQPVLSQFDVTIEDWRGACLLLPSIVRLHKLATLEKRLVERRLGELASDDWARVRSTLTTLWPV
jgi:mRNA interferase MazF